MPKVQSVIQQIRAAMPEAEVKKSSSGGGHDEDDYAFEWETHNLGELLAIKG